MHCEREESRSSLTRYMHDIIYNRLLRPTDIKGINEKKLECCLLKLWEEMKSAFSEIEDTLLSTEVITCKEKCFAFGPRE